MGNSPDAFGKPLYSDGFNLPGDIAAAVEFADEFANVRRGTNTERQSAPPTKLRDGMLWVETDTGAIYEWRTATGWRIVHAPDTGWKPVGSLVTGWTVQAGDTFDYRVVGQVLFFRGRLNATTAAPQLNILTNPLPAAVRPGADSPRFVGVTGGGGQSYVVVIAANGQLNVYKGSNSVLNLPGEGFGGIPVG